MRSHLVLGFVVACAFFFGVAAGWVVARPHVPPAGPAPDSLALAAIADSLHAAQVQLEVLDATTQSAARWADSAARLGETLHAQRRAGRTLPAPPPSADSTDAAALARLATYWQQRALTAEAERAGMEEDARGALDLVAAMRDTIGAIARRSAIATGELRASLEAASDSIRVGADSLGALHREIRRLALNTSLLRGAVTIGGTACLTEHGPVLGLGAAIGAGRRLLGPLGGTGGGCAAWDAGAQRVRPGVGAALGLTVTR